MNMAKHNEYSTMVKDGLFEKTPKAVFAALYISELINRLGVPDDGINKAIVDEWHALFNQGIVPQKPPHHG